MERFGGNHLKEIIITERQFRSKRIFYSEIGGHVLRPDFGTCQGRVLQRRKGSASYDRWVCRGGPRLEILLTEEGEIDRIFWLRFGNSYLVLELVLFLKIE